MKKYIEPTIIEINIDIENGFTCSCGRPGNHFGHHKDRNFDSFDECENDSYEY